MHKYNMTVLLEHAAKLVITEKDWAQGKKKMKHTVGAGRLAGIGREVTAAAIPRQQVTDIEMVMAEFKVCGIEDVLRKCPRRKELPHHLFSKKFEREIRSPLASSFASAVTWARHSSPRSLLLRVPLAQLH
eukprot:gene17644-23988_t